VRPRSTAPRLAHALLLALAGCTPPSVDTPVSWWHDLQGGRIAEERPAAPGADAPYRNLATVPAKPTGEDPAQRARIAGLLAADRAAANLAPPAIQPPPAAPAAAPAPAPADAMGGSLAAASNPAATPIRPAPPPAPAPAPTSAPAAVTPAVMPAIPDRPPPPPLLPGVSQVTAPRPAPRTPAPAAKPYAPAIAAPAATSVAVPFADGSADLPAPIAAQLRGLATARGTRAIAVSGFGDASLGDQADQARRLPLAWSRAAAIAGVLREAGVPPDRLLIAATASGRGGLARIAD